MISCEVVDTNSNRYKRHAAAINFLGKTAENAFGVELSQKTLSNWTMANLLIRDVDSVYDGNDVSEKDAVTSTLIEIFGSTGSDEYLLNDDTNALAHTLRNQLTDRQAELFLKRGLQIIELQKELRKVDAPRDYGELLLLEGQLQSSMFLIIADPADQHKPGFDKFANFFLTGSGLANVIDSIADIKTDYEEGQTCLSPSMANRIGMLPAVENEIYKAAGMLPLKSMISFAGPALEIIKDRKRTPDL